MEMKNIYSGRLRGGGEDTWRRYNGLVAARWAEGSMAVHIPRFGHVESPLHHAGQWRTYPGLSGIGQVKVK